MPGEHARLSPSAAERWISCPASIRLGEEVGKDDEESEFASEGTCAHALAEIRAGHYFGQLSVEEFTAELQRWSDEWSGRDWDFEDMQRHVGAYVSLIEERLDLYPQSQVMFEQRMDTGVASCWGTSDTVIVSPQHVEIIDFKYGQGVAVEAEGNPQLRLYALGALDTFGDLLGETETVRITVHQPRLHHVLTEEITPEALRKWREVVAAPAAALALGPEAPFGPSEDACRWCPASGQCRAQLEDVFTAADFDSPPDLLSPSEMAEALGRVGAIKNWLKAFEEAALATAYSRGKSLPGYKVVMSGGRRVIDDQEGALEALHAAGYPQDEVAEVRLYGIGRLEKTLQEAFDIVLEDFVRKTEGRPSLVPESDRRKPINPNSDAQKEFSNES